MLKALLAATAMLLAANFVGCGQPPSINEGIRAFSSDGLIVLSAFRDGRMICRRYVGIEDPLEHLPTDSVYVKSLGAYFPDSDTLVLNDKEWLISNVSKTHPIVNRIIDIEYLGSSIFRIYTADGDIDIDCRSNQPRNVSSEYQ